MSSYEVHTAHVCVHIQYIVILPVFDLINTMYGDTVCQPLF